MATNKTEIVVHSTLDFHPDHDATPTVLAVLLNEPALAARARAAVDKAFGESRYVRSTHNGAELTNWDDPRASGVLVNFFADEFVPTGDGAMRRLLLFALSRVRWSLVLAALRPYAPAPPTSAADAY